MAKGKKESGYPASMREEELKNRVAADWFAGRDAARILGNVDFCVEAAGESLVWAEAKRGSAPLDFALVQLILTIGKERTFDRNLPPRFLAAFNASQIWFLPYSDVAEVFYQNDFNWNVAPSDHSTREFRELHHRVSKAIADNSLVFAFDEDAKDLRKFLKRALGRAVSTKPPLVGGSQSSATAGRAVSMKPPCDERRVALNAPYQSAAIRAFLEGPPVAELTGHEFEGIKGYKPLVAAIHEYLSRGEMTVVNESVGSVRLTKAGIIDSLQHGFGRAKLSAFAALPKLARKGIVVRRSENWKGRGYASCVLAAPLSIGGGAYCAFVVVNKSPNGDSNYYLHEVGKIPSGTCDHGLATRSPHCPASPMPSPRVSRSGAPVCGDGAYPLLGDIRSLAYSIFAVNGESNGVFSSAIADVYDKKGEPLGKKTILSYDGLKPINDWIVQFASNDYSDRSMGTIIAVANYFQNRGTINLCEPNKKWNHKFQWQVLPENVMVSSIYFAVRLCIEHTVMNHNDQFLFPNGGWESDAEFQMDCLVYTLFHGKNRIMSADGVNHWIPFTEEEVGAKDNFASHFMSEVLAGRLSRRVEGNAPYQGRDEARLSRPDGAAKAGAASPAARAVLDAGRALWRHYHALPDANPNASFYDIRLRFQGAAVDSRGKAKMNADSPDEEYTRLLAALRAAHRALAAKIEPKVYEYGFLRK